jgi:hypothetical protein
VRKKSCVSMGKRYFDFFRTLCPPLFLKLQRYFITTGHHLFAGHRSSSSLNEEYDAFVLNRLSLNRLSVSPSCLPRLHTRARAHRREAVRPAQRGKRKKRIFTAFGEAEREAMLDTILWGPRSTGIYDADEVPVPGDLAATPD